jgi:Fe-S oxidoreductase
MIDQAQVEHIKEYGVPGDKGEGRLAVLREQIGFPMDQPAEYVIIAGCFQPGTMPGVLSAFKEVLDRLEVSYTMLTKEYCCGWMPIGQPAVMMKDEENIKEFREVSKEFVRENFKQAKDLGAKSLAFFCAACEPNYSNCKDETDIEFVSYVEMLDRHFQGGRLDKEIDYYAGCYRFRRKITEEPIDVDHGAKLLKKIDGLKVNEVDNKLCCYIPPHLEQLGDNIASEELVAICTGCYHNLNSMLQSKEDIQVTMLPELLLQAI